MSKRGMRGRSWEEKKSCSLWKWRNLSFSFYKEKQNNLNIEKNKHRYSFSSYKNITFLWFSCGTKYYILNFFILFSWLKCNYLKGKSNVDDLVVPFFFFHEWGPLAYFAAFNILIMSHNQDNQVVNHNLWFQIYINSKQNVCLSPFVFHRFFNTFFTFFDQIEINFKFHAPLLNLNKCIVSKAYTFKYVIWNLFAMGSRHFRFFEISDLSFTWFAFCSSKTVMLCL